MEKAFHFMKENLEDLLTLLLNVWVQVQVIFFLR
jgi:hypothetical protein